jgi:signal peptidase II
VLVILLDQLTKWWASAELSLMQPVPVLPVFNFTLLHNPGAAFSFLSNAGGWQRWFFTGLALVVSLVLVIWLWRLPKGNHWLACSLALILGGALGNFIDRLWLGYVIDFLDFHYAGYHFPAFNLADTAISLGAVMLVVDWLRGGSKSASR